LEDRTNYKLAYTIDLKGLRDCQQK